MDDNADPVVDLDNDASERRSASFDADLAENINQDDDSLALPAPDIDINNRFTQLDTDIMELAAHNQPGSGAEERAERDQGRFGIELTEQPQVAACISGPLPPLAISPIPSPDPEAPVIPVTADEHVNMHVEFYYNEFLPGSQDAAPLHFVLERTSRDAPLSTTTDNISNYVRTHHPQVVAGALSILDAPATTGLNLALHLVRINLLPPLSYHACQYLSDYRH
jgi:hypothetical protein